MEIKEGHSTAPAWLDEYSVPDDVFACAYGSVSKEIRGQLKTAIARLHVMLGEAASSSLLRTEFRQGFSVTSAYVPAPYAVLLIDSAYSHPAACLAACLPLILSGIPFVYPCFLNSSYSGTKTVTEGTNIVVEPSFDLLTGLEFAGLSQCYFINEKVATELLKYLFESSGVGRLVVLGESFFAMSTICYALEHGIPSQTLLRQPVATPCQEGDNPVVDASVLSLLQFDTDHDFMWFWPQLTLAWCQQTSFLIQRSK